MLATAFVFVVAVVVVVVVVAMMMVMVMIMMMVMIMIVVVVLIVVVIVIVTARDGGLHIIADAFGCVELAFVFALFFATHLIGSPPLLPGFGSGFSTH